MTRTLRALAIFVALSSSAAYAQLPDLGDPLGKFSDSLSNYCPNIEKYDFLLGDVSDALTWICGLRPAIDRASDLVEGWQGDVNGFLEGSLADTASMVASVTGVDLGSVDLEGTLTGAREDIRSGNFSAEAFAGEMIARVNRVTFDSLDAPAAAGASDIEKAVIDNARMDPARKARELEDMGLRTEAVMRNARSQDLANAARGLAATSLARGDEEQLMNRVTNPAPGQQGSADKAQDLGTNATSTRAAVQALVNAEADRARQDALSTANIVTAMKEQALQQTFTTQQLSLLEQTLTDQALREHNKWRDEYYEVMAERAAGAEDLRANFAAVGQMMTELGGGDAGGDE